MNAKNRTPWHDEEGNLNFSYKPILDKCLIWPFPPPSKLGKKQLIIIPEKHRKEYHNGTGIILAIGQGYTDNKGKLHLTPSELKPGTKVLFDISVPWGEHFEAPDGKEHFVYFCSTADVYGLVD